MSSSSSRRRRFCLCNSILYFSSDGSIRQTIYLVDGAILMASAINVWPFMPLATPDVSRRLFTRTPAMTLSNVHKKGETDPGFTSSLTKTMPYIVRLFSSPPASPKSDQPVARTNCADTDSFYDLRWTVLLIIWLLSAVYVFRVVD